MPRIAITGHMNLAPASVELIRSAIVRELASYSSDVLTGISCIACGADSIFAEAVLDQGGTLEVVLPSRSYRETKVKPDHESQFDELLKKARHVLVMPFDVADRDAYEAANEALVTRCDRLFAVWDGEPAQKSGTGSVVECAEARSVPVTVIWPEGATRT